MGANTTAFGTGAYGLSLNFGTGDSPTIPLPNTQTANGTPLSGGGGVAEHTGSSGDYDQYSTGTATWRREWPAALGTATPTTLTLLPPAADAVRVASPPQAHTAVGQEQSLSPKEVVALLPTHKPIETDVCDACFGALDWTGVLGEPEV
jgi:hypothetical protein